MQDCKTDSQNTGRQHHCALNHRRRSRGARGAIIDSWNILEFSGHTFSHPTVFEPLQHYCALNHRKGCKMTPSVTTGAKMSPAFQKSLLNFNVRLHQTHPAACEQAVKIAKKINRLLIKHCWKSGVWTMLWIIYLWEATWYGDTDRRQRGQYSWWPRDLVSVLLYLPRIMW